MVHVMDSSGVAKGMNAYQNVAYDLERCNLDIIPKEAANYVLSPVQTYRCLPKGFSKQLSKTLLVMVSG